MRLFELVPTATASVIVRNDRTGHMQVLTCQGTVYDNEDTKDVRNMAIAYGLLTTSEHWRLATEEETVEWRLHAPVKMLELHWAMPPARPKPKLTVIKNEPAQVVYEKDGMKIYDDDDTQ